MNKKKAIIVMLLSTVVASLILYHLTRDDPKRVDNATQVRIECAKTDTELMSKWDDYSKIITEAMKAGVEARDLRKEALATGRAGVRATRHWISACGHYIPEAVAEYTQLLNNLVPELDRLEGMK